MREIRKARDHEEHVDPGEAAGKQRAIGVEGDHPDDRERAQPVDVRSEIEVAPASRRGEVGRVEGLIQRGFPWTLGESETGKAQCGDPQGALAAPAARPIMPVMPNADPKKPRAALFRARDDAARSAARLRRLGFAVARLPAIEIVALAYTPERKRYDAVVAASDKAFVADVSVDRASPLYVVGARTARAAEARGWRLAAPSAPDSRRLAEILKGAMPRAAAVLYLAGRDRKPAIEAAFADIEAFEVGRSLCGRTAAKLASGTRSARSKRAGSRFIIRAGRPRSPSSSPAREARPRISA